MDSSEYRKLIADVKREAELKGDVDKRDQLEREIQSLVQSRPHDMTLYHELKPMADELARLNKLIGVRRPKSPRKPKPQSGADAAALEADDTEATEVKAGK